jgi:hypothetical protein
VKSTVLLKLHAAISAFNTIVEFPAVPSPPRNYIFKIWRFKVYAKTESKLLKLAQTAIAVILEFKEVTSRAGHD